MLGRYTTGPVVARAEHSRWTGGCQWRRRRRRLSCHGNVCDDAEMDVVAMPPLVFVILGAIVVVVIVGAWLLRRD